MLASSAVRVVRDIVQATMGGCWISDIIPALMAALATIKGRVCN